MALKEGKRTVKLKASVADNIGIPKFPDTNIAKEISKPLADIADTFRKTAEADMKIDWQYNFNKNSRDHYLDLREKFKGHEYFQDTINFCERWYEKCC